MKRDHRKDIFRQLLSIKVVHSDRVCRVFPVSRTEIAHHRYAVRTVILSVSERHGQLAVVSVISIAHDFSGIQNLI